MPSASAPVPSRFVPSASLARLALQAAEEPQARGGVRVWVSCFPEAKFIDEAALFAPPRDRMEATPETLPEADMRDLVQRTQEAIGTRVERLLSSFAFEAAARKETTFLVTEGDQFTAPICEGLLQSLPIPSGKSGPVFSRLVHELREAARKQMLGGDWGWLREGPRGLVLEIAGPLERLPADRPRARVVGGIARGR